MNLRLRHWVVWIGAAATFAVVPALAEDIKPGKWEYSFQMQGSTLPATTQIPPEQLAKISPAARAQLEKMQQGGGVNFTTTSCVTADHAMRPIGPRNGQCAISKMDHSGADVSYAASCTSKEGRTTTMEGQMHYSGDAMAGEIHVRTAPRDGKAVDVTQHITGRYLGPCG